MIGKMIDRDQKDWDSALPYVMAAYQSSRNESTGYTPNNLMLGREVRTPMDIVFAMQPETPPRLYSDYADELEERLRLAYSDVRRHLGVAATRNKRRYDMKTGRIQSRRESALLLTAQVPRTSGCVNLLAHSK